MLSTIKLLGVAITNETEDDILEYIFRRLKKPEEKFFIVTPNPEILVHANFHLDYKDKLNKAAISLPDGVGLFVGAGLLGHPLKERIPGVDFMEELCKSSANKPVSIGFLGGRPGVAKSTAECLIKKYPPLKVRWIGSEWDEDSETSPYISPDDPIDILFVAFGFPKQEEWIYENLEKLPVKAAMGVGGAFDYISGNVIRAPYLVRAIGFEWLFRLIRQPWRIRRQWALVVFVFLLVKERFTRKRFHKSTRKRV